MRKQKTLLPIKTNFVYDERKKKIAVILNIKDFDKYVDILEDYQDHQLILERRNKKEKYIPFEVVMQKALNRSKK